MAKRTTRTNAKTLDNIRKQAEERGRALGRQDLAVELASEMHHDALRDLWIWIKGRTSTGERDYIVDSGRDALRAALSASAKITEEANTPAF